MVNCKKCGHIINANDLDVSNCTNEIGEEYYEYYISCKCGDINLEGSSWGDCYGEDFIELYHECISKLKEFV